MPTFALTLLVLLSPGDESLAESIASAARATLGSELALEVRVEAKPVTDDAARELARNAGSRALAVIDWRDRGKLRARIRLYTQTTERWLVRELEFTSEDTPAERGRTIGFSLASMLPENTPGEPQSDASPAPEHTSGEPQSVASPAPTAPARPSAAGVSHSPLTSQPLAAKPWTFALDLAGQGVLGVGGEGTAVGGELGGQYRLGEHFSLRLAAALRVGHLEQLEARALTLDLAPGLSWRSGDTGPAQAWGLALSLAAVARLQSVRRAPIGSTAPESHGRWLPGVGVGLEVNYALNHEAALFVSSGLRALLGETDLFLRGRHVASFAPLELGLGLGARFGF